MSSWCTIESDPGVFTELISSFGVRNVQVEELYTLDSAHICNLQPVYGLIFLFKWQSDEERTQGTVDMEDDDYSTAAQSTDPSAPRLFFARQMIHNACATQAIINVLLNNPDIELGSEISNFRDFTLELPPDVRGLALGECELIRRCHNAFRRPEAFVFEEKRATKDEEAEDAFHFVSYVHVAGKVYELDGLQKQPIMLKQCSREEWTEAALQSIQQKINQYASKEIRFNLMAVCKNRTQVYREEIDKLQQQKQILSSQPSNPQQQRQLAHIESHVTELRNSLDDEASKLEKWRLENIRRKFNYVPFIFQLLKLLAEKQKLPKLVEKACRITAERQARTRERSQKQQEAEKQSREHNKQAATTLQPK